jgi:hypothetical protein
MLLYNNVQIPNKDRTWTQIICLGVAAPLCVWFEYDSQPSGPVKKIFKYHKSVLDVPGLLKRKLK